MYRADHASPERHQAARRASLAIVRLAAGPASAEHVHELADVVSQWQRHSDAEAWQAVAELEAIARQHQTDAQTVTTGKEN